jgi:hypothetical protein
VRIRQEIQKKITFYAINLVGSIEIVGRGHVLYIWTDFCEDQARNPKKIDPILIG